MLHKALLVSTDSWVLRMKKAMSQALFKLSLENYKTKLNSISPPFPNTVTGGGTLFSKSQAEILSLKKEELRESYSPNCGFL